MRLSIVVVLSFAAIQLLSCGNAYERRILKENSREVATQYKLLMDESQEFFRIHPELSVGATKYLDEGDTDLSKEKAAGMQKLQPLITDAAGTKVILLVYNRTTDAIGKRVDFIRFVSGKYTDEKWHFGFRKGHHFSFYYPDPAEQRLTEEQLAREAIRNLMLMGYFKEESSHPEKLFVSDFYVLK